MVQVTAQFMQSEDFSPL